MWQNESRSPWRFLVKLGIHCYGTSTSHLMHNLRRSNRCFVCLLVCFLIDWLIDLLLFLQLWVWSAIIVVRKTHGTTVKQQVNHARKVWIDAPRCTWNSVQKRCSPNIALAVLVVPRTATLPARVLLGRSNVTSAAVMVTTATLVRLLASAVSCCWHAPWHLWWFSLKLDIGVSSRQSCNLVFKV